MTCAVKFCKNVLVRDGKSFFSFPADAELSKIWLKFCQRTDKFQTKHARVCMDHFDVNCIANELQYKMGYASRRILKPGSIPTIPTPQMAVEPQGICALDLEELSLKKPSDEKKDEEFSIPKFFIDREKLVGVDDNVKAEDVADDLRDPLEIASPVSADDYSRILLKKIDFLMMKNANLRASQRSSIDKTRQLRAKLLESRTKYEQNIKIMEDRLKKMEYAKKNMENKLKTIFTEGQLNMMQSDAEGVNLTEEDIAQSITLYAVSARAYKMLHRKGFPLPSVQTLQKWTQKVDISPGIMETVLQVLSASIHMTTLEKLCVLSFGEMKIQKSYVYSKTSDSTLEPASYVQVAMLTGLMSNWKQPVFYDFDCKMTFQLLKSILLRTTTCGYTVAAVVCDLEETNRTLRNEIDENKPWFLFNDEKVFVFADVPESIKHLRNHFLDDGFILNANNVKADIVFESLKSSSADKTIIHKISTAHLNVSGVQRQKLEMATTLFSHTTTQAIAKSASLGYLNGRNWKECYHIFKVTNEWFDVMNSRVPGSERTSRSNAYGVHLASQNAILDKMTEMVKNVRAIGKRGLLPFQKGIIQSTNALKLMFPELKRRFGIQYILTSSLNQTDLSTFFEMMRVKSNSYDYPDRQAFKYRLRSYILGRNEGNLPTSQTSLTGVIFNAINIDPLEDNKEKEEQEIDSLKSDGLENIAEYICHKLQQEALHKNPKKDTHWIEVGSPKPSQKMMAYMAELEKIFNEINGDDLLITRNFIQVHITNAHHVQCSTKIKGLFFRAKMYSRIKKLNQEMSENVLKKRRKLN